MAAARPVTGAEAVAAVRPVTGAEAPLPKFLATTTTAPRLSLLPPLLALPLRDTNTGSYPQWGLALYGLALTSPGHDPKHQPPLY